MGSGDWACKLTWAGSPCYGGNHPQSRLAGIEAATRRNANVRNGVFDAKCRREERFGGSVRSKWLVSNLI